MTTTERQSTAPRRELAAIMFSDIAGDTALTGHDEQQALAVIEELNHKSVHGYVPPFNLAAVYVGISDRERALDDLEKACAATSPSLMILKMDRMFEALRSDPRFIVLLKNLHLNQ